MSARIPEYAETFHPLKMTDSHVEKLLDEYLGVNRQAHRMETEVEAVSSETGKHVRESGVHLEDRIR